VADVDAAGPLRHAEMQKATLEGWFIDILPDLNQDDREVARYIIQNTLWWVGVSGLDGIRQDTLPYAPAASGGLDGGDQEGVPGPAGGGELLDGDPALVSFYQGGVPRFDGIDSGSTRSSTSRSLQDRDAFAKGGSLRTWRCCWPATTSTATRPPSSPFSASTTCRAS